MTEKILLVPMREYILDSHKELTIYEAIDYYQLIFDLNKYVMPVPHNLYCFKGIDSSAFDSTIYSIDGTEIAEEALTVRLSKVATVQDMLIPIICFYHLTEIAIDSSVLSSEKRGQILTDFHITPDKVNLCRFSELFTLFDASPTDDVLDPDREMVIDERAAFERISDIYTLDGFVWYQKELKKYGLEKKAFEKVIEEFDQLYKNNPEQALQTEFYKAFRDRKEVKVIVNH